jgi:Na+-driven multidrug efflux pump
MDCITGSLRGMGKSLSPMLMTLFGVCAVRIAWVWWVFPLKHSMVLLMLSYPVSYIVNIILTGATLCWSLKKYMEHNKKEHYGEVRLS